MTKKSKIKVITLDNFCKHKELSVELGQKTVIGGKNGIGKSTVKTAIQYVLNVRNENGKEITGIRPHDENGVDIDGLVTSVAMVVESDGAENELKKEMFQKKNRQGEYTGEDNINYYIDGVKKGTKKSYDEFVQTIIPNEICLNASTLLTKDTAGRREMLKAFEKHTDEDVINENPQFECLRGKLRANKVADIRKALNEKIKGSKSILGYEQQQLKIETEIELLEKSKVDIDVAELELQRNGLKEQMAEVKAKQEDVSKQTEEYQKLSDGILELKFAEGDLQRKANEENIKKRREIEDKISEKNGIKFQTERMIEDIERDITTRKNSLIYYEKILNNARAEWKAANERLFDENSLICSYCGQEYPSEKKEQLRTEFESQKAEQLKGIEENGNIYKRLLEEEKDTIVRLEEKIPKRKENIELMNKGIADLEKQLSELPTSINISDTEEYKDIQKQIADKEEALAKMNNASEIKQSLNSELEDLQSQLTECEKQIALAQKNVEIDEQILELQGKIRENAQNIADVEKELYLLKEFERKKAELLEKDVNEYFEFATVKMFDAFQNGEIKDICEFTYQGTEYGRGLNHGARMLTEIDICRAFQKLYGVCTPIIVEDAESLDSDKIPNIPNQLILIKRTDDEELKIDVVE